MNTELEELKKYLASIKKAIEPLGAKEHLGKGYVGDNLEFYRAGMLLVVASIEEFLERGNSDVDNEK